MQLVFWLLWLWTFVDIMEPFIVAEIGNIFSVLVFFLAKLIILRLVAGVLPFRSTYYSPRPFFFFF